jgi:hypothetical protein
VTLYLEYDARPDAFGDTPQTVTIRAGGETVETFPATEVTPRLRRVAIPATALGPEEMAEITISVDRTFQPAAAGGGVDSRELGIRVYHVFVEPR